VRYPSDRCSAAADAIDECSPLGCSYRRLLPAAARPITPVRYGYHPPPAAEIEEPMGSGDQRCRREGWGVARRVIHVQGTSPSIIYAPSVMARFSLKRRMVPRTVAAPPVLSVYAPPAGGTTRAAPRSAPPPATAAARGGCLRWRTHPPSSFRTPCSSRCRRMSASWCPARAARRLASAQCL
jgi:hypothetical protein